MEPQASELQTPNSQPVEDIKAENLSALIAANTKSQISGATSAGLIALVLLFFSFPSNWVAIIFALLFFGNMRSNGQKFNRAGEALYDLSPQTAKDLVSDNSGKPKTLNQISKGIKNLPPSPPKPQPISKETPKALDDSGAKSEFKIYHPSDLVDGEFLKNLIVIGASGSGKTVFYGHYLRALTLKYPEISLYYLTAVDRPGDSGAIEPLLPELNRAVFGLTKFNHQTPSRVVNAAFQAYLEVLMRFVHQTSSMSQPKLLIVDEYPAYRLAWETFNQETDDPEALLPAGESLLKGLKFQTIMQAHGGRGDGVAVSGISPNGSVESLGVPRYGFGGSNAVFLGNIDLWNSTVYLTARQNQLAPEKPPSDELKQFCKDNDLSRVIGFGGEWYPLENLTPFKPTRDVPLLAWEDLTQEPAIDVKTVEVKEPEPKPPEPKPEPKPPEPKPEPKPPEPKPEPKPPEPKPEPDLLERVQKHFKYVNRGKATKDYRSAAKVFDTLRKTRKSLTLQETEAACQKLVKAGFLESPDNNPPWTYRLRS